MDAGGNNCEVMGFLFSELCVPLSSHVNPRVKFHRNYGKSHLAYSVPAKDGDGTAAS
jgi:hypothetical protein